jgi:hypothetical protein
MFCSVVDRATCGYSAWVLFITLAHGLLWSLIFVTIHLETNFHAELRALHEKTLSSEALCRADRTFKG